MIIKKSLEQVDVSIKIYWNIITGELSTSWILVVHLLNKQRYYNQMKNKQHFVFLLFIMFSTFDTHIYKLPPHHYRCLLKKEPTIKYSTLTGVPNFHAYQNIKCTTKSFSCVTLLENLQEVCSSFCKMCRIVQWRSSSTSVPSLFMTCLICDLQPPNWGIKEPEWSVVKFIWNSYCGDNLTK